jgi:hypothetical protein
MTTYFKAVPQHRNFYGVRCDAQGEPNRSQVEQALGSIVIVEFRLPQNEKRNRTPSNLFHMKNIVCISHKNYGINLYRLHKMYV